MMKYGISAVAVLVTGLVAACDSSSNSGESSSSMSSTTFALSGADFSGNSVRICGSRLAPDPKYRCNFSLTPDIEAGADAGDACPCFNFTAEGNLLDEEGAPLVIHGLCPSSDYPTADWDFSYAIYSAPNCGGTQINDGAHNFTCYDSKDIATQEFPNHSVESLNPGLNTNHILCTTDNASKDWNFASCATVTTDADIAADKSRYDCGCTPAAGTCDCGPGGVTSGDLQPGCSFDPATCDIVCKGPERIAQVSAGGNFTCGVGLNGLAYCWGWNISGQLGNNTTTRSLVPIAVDTSGVLADKTITQIAAGSNHAYAIASDGLAYCWGYNATGQLGNNSTTNSLVPVAVDTSGVLAGKTITQIAAGNLHGCAIASDGQAYCWGYNADGRLGNNSTTQSLVPVAVDTSGVLAGKTITQISTGNNHTCAIASDARAYCWGYNSAGQLGNNSTTTSPVPVAVDTSGVLAGKTITQVSANLTNSIDNHTCAITSDGLAYCWGINNSGQLGNNTTTGSRVPVAVDTSGVLAGKTITQISTAGGLTCAITSDGQAYCWGSNNSGQLGNNTTTNSSVPVAVDTSGVLAGKTITQISTGYSYACAITSDARAYCWGYNPDGRLGNNTTTTSHVPVLVLAPVIP